MTVLIYIGSIIGALVVMFGIYELIKRYSSIYVIVCSIGSGIFAAKLIIAKDLSIPMGVAAVIACGVIAGIIAIPAMLISDMETLEEELEELKKPEPATE